MTKLEDEIRLIDQEYKLGNIGLDEKNHLLAEIRDIRAAQECAGNEELLRHIVQCCNIAMAVL